MEKISWTDHVRYGEVLQRGRKKGNILHTAHRRKVNWIGHFLRGNCLLKHVIGGNIERRVRRRRIKHWQLLDDLQETRKCCKLKEMALDRTVRRIGFGRGCGPVIRKCVKCVGSEVH
jgi:hypothetical protein